MVRLITIVVVLLIGSTTLHAEGDAAYGEYLSTACVTCHQLTGKDNGIPSIVGWDQTAFVKTLQSYQAEERENPVMRMITKPMSLEEMKALAAYFATIKPIEDPDE